MNGALVPSFTSTAIVFVVVIVVVAVVVEYGMCVTSAALFLRGIKALGISVVGVGMD